MPTSFGMFVLEVIGGPQTDAKKVSDNIVRISKWRIEWKANFLSRDAQEGEVRRDCVT